MEGKEVKVQTVKPSAMDSIRRATSYAAYRVGRVAYKGKVTREVYDAAADLAGVAGKLVFKDYERGTVRSMILDTSDLQRSETLYGAFSVTNGSYTTIPYSYEDFKMANGWRDASAGKTGDHSESFIVRACRYIRESDNRISTIISRYVLNKAWRADAHYLISNLNHQIAMGRAAAEDDRGATADNLAAARESAQNIRDAFFYRSSMELVGEINPFADQPDVPTLLPGQRVDRFIGEIDPYTGKPVIGQFRPYPIDFFFNIAYVFHTIRNFFIYGSVKSHLATGGDKTPTKEANLGATLRDSRFYGLTPRGHGDGLLQQGKAQDTDQGGIQTGKPGDFGRPFVPQPDAPTLQPGQRTDRYSGEMDPYVGKPIEKGTPFNRVSEPEQHDITIRRLTSADREGGTGGSDNARYNTAMRLEPLHTAQKGWLARFIGLFVSPKPQEKAPEVSRTDDDKKI